MRAREFIAENMVEPYSQDQIRPDTKAALPSMTKFTDVDNSSPYNGWRFGIAMAGAPNQKMPAAGASGQKMVVVPYTDAESEIIDSAAKMIGVKSSKMSSDGSHELSNAGVVSPVAKKRKNRYGV